MEEHQLKVLCYNCNEKYSLEHRCKEHQLFVDIFEDIYDDELDGRTQKESPPIIEEFFLPNPVKNPISPLII